LGGWRYLEAAPASTEWTDKEWGSSGTLIGGTETGIGTGQSNTSTIVDWLNSHSWFLPSKDELNLMYENLYVFEIGSFANDYYWSSSEGTIDYAWDQNFDYGSQYNYYKSNCERVRAVRAF